MVSDVSVEDVCPGGNPLVCSQASLKSTLHEFCRLLLDTGPGMRAFLSYSHVSYVSCSTRLEEGLADIVKQEPCRARKNSFRNHCFYGMS